MLTIKTDSMKERLLTLSNTAPWGQKAGRFTQALAERLKPEISVNGFIMSCEMVLINEENDYDRADRIRIRNLLPEIAQSIISGEFLQELREELADIKRTTRNMD